MGVKATQKGMEKAVYSRKDSPDALTINIGGMPPITVINSPTFDTITFAVREGTGFTLSGTRVGTVGVPTINIAVILPIIPESKAVRRQKVANRRLGLYPLVFMAFKAIN